MDSPRLTGLVLLCALVSLAVGVQADIRLQQVDRKINLNSQLVRITESIKAKNTGDKTASSVVLCQYVRPGAVIAFHKVVDSAKAELKASPEAVGNTPEGGACFTVALPSPLPPGETISLTSTVVLGTAQTAYPAEIAQNENQLMVYTDNLYVVSPYVVSSQTTEVSMPGSVKSYSDVKPVSTSGNKVSYGKYDLIKPFTMEELRVHFENNKPFKHVVTYVKEIEISHWGNIYVEEKYELKNAGAKHTGAFSRLKYAHSYNGKGNSFRDLKARLPAGAHSMYYVDLIGNISTSNVRSTKSETILEFNPRYPLMGGWKVDFTIGYSVPLEGFLFRKRSDGKRRLTMDLSTPLEDVYVEDAIVRVVLPEGSNHISAVLPYNMEQSFDTKYTYLDTTGRPVLVLHKKHLVPEHASKFSVDYSFASTSMLREPLLLVTGFFCLLLAVIVYNRLEFTISRDDKWQEAQTQEKLATFMEQIQGLLEEEEELLSGLGKVAAKVRVAEDVEGANKERAAIEKKVADIEDKVKVLLTSVEACSTRVATQVRDVLDKVRALDGRYAKQLSERISLVKKGTLPAEVTRQLSRGQAELAVAKKGVQDLMENVFGAY